MAEKQQLIAIVHQLQNGNEDAASTLYEAYYRDLHYYILKRVNDPENAEDLTQDTFIEMFETIGTLSDADRFVAWSRQIADRRCDAYNKARKRLLFGKVGKATVDSVAEERKNLHSDEEANEKKANHSIHTMMDTLSEEQRAAVLMKYVGDDESDDSWATENDNEKKVAIPLPGMKAGAKIVGSVVRKVIVGVVAALILAAIRGGGIDWLHKENTLGSEAHGTTEQVETAEEIESVGEIKTTEAIKTTEEIKTMEEIKTTEEIETTEEIKTTEEIETTEEETETSVEESESESEIVTEGATPEETEPEETAVVVTEPETTKAEETEPQPEETMAPEMVELSLLGGYWMVEGIGTYKGTDIVIPESYDGLPVEGISFEAFAYNHSLTSVQLPDGIHQIQTNAFAHCDRITSINLPDSIHFIGPDALCGCSGLTSITLPASLEKIMDRTFSSCSNLKSVTFSESIYSIGEEAFYGCTSLNEIIIPAGIKSIAATAFYRCFDLEKIVVDEVNPIYYSVDNCLIAKSSKKLVLCGNRSVIPMDGSITSIGDYACANCDKWTEVVIPDGVTSIGDYAFDYLNLQKIMIPESVTSIGQRAFGLNSNLKAIIYAGTISQWKAIEKGLDWNMHSGNYTVYCTDGEIPQWEDVQ